MERYVRTAEEEAAESIREEREQSLRIREAALEAVVAQERAAEAAERSARAEMEERIVSFREEAEASITERLEKEFSSKLETSLRELEGSMRDGPWSYRITSILAVSPIYATLLVTFGTVAGRHRFFARMASNIFGRFLPNAVIRRVADSFAWCFPRSVMK